MMDIQIEANEALYELRRIEKEIADAYWVEGGRVNDADLERWAGEIYAARDILHDIILNHLETTEYDDTDDLDWENATVIEDD